MDLVARAKAILVSPRSEWEVIDHESTSVGELYKGYIMPLAAIGPIATFVGMSIFGYSALGVVVKTSIMTGLTWMVERYVLSLVSVYLFALIVNAMAPTFGAEKNQAQALKVVAYCMTAAWLAGVFAILPALAIFALLGLYSLYLLYIGLPVLMKCPPDKAMGYTVTAIIVGFALFLVLGYAVRMIAPGAMGM